MKIDFLEKLDFNEIQNIEELKTSRSSVEFYKKSENDFGKSSKITTPDLRYFWDGLQFGIHASDSDFHTQQWVQFLVENTEIAAKAKVIYFGRTDIEVFTNYMLDFNQFEFLYLSENPYLFEILLQDCNKLNSFEATNCASLRKVELIGTFDVLKKIELSYCEIHMFIMPQIKSLEYLNIQHNKIGNIDISEMPKLKYLFGSNNDDLELTWPKEWNLENLSILGVDDSNKKLSKDIIEIAKDNSDEQLITKIKSFLGLRNIFSELNQRGETILNRIQVMLIGNTTAGKTELKHQLLGITRSEDEKSTHGVLHFTKTLKDGTEVVGYDFGGQDYYHSVHLSFFDEATHYILVWGNNTDIVWGSYDSEAYHSKIEPLYLNNIKIGEDENLLYPLKYWIGSIINHGCLDCIPIKSLSITENKGDQPFISQVSQKLSLDILQNQREGTAELHINNKDLKQTPNIAIEEIKSFDFRKKPNGVGKWLENRLQGLVKEQNSVLLAVQNLGKELKKDSKVIYSKSELRAIIKSKYKQLKDETIEEFIDSLRRNRFIFYPGYRNSNLEDFYIIQIDKFTDYLYQILSKELATSDKNQGYFTQEEALLRVKSDEAEIKKYVLRYLEESKIIFKVVNSEDQNPTFIAPSYLPNPKLEIERLFINSFEEPDCIFEFKGYFKSNLILEIVATYFKQIVKDGLKYLIWKNCVIIYNFEKNENQNIEDEEKNKPKNFIKFELLLPNKSKPDLIPTFTIARNNAAHVENDKLGKKFDEIKTMFLAYNPKISVKTPYGNYIDYGDVKAVKEGKNKKSQFIHSNNVLYPIYDFRHLGVGFHPPLKIFIAYSKFDDIYRLELRDHLYPGIASGEFIVFDDREMEMGEKWNARLKKELEQCDIFIVLMSVKLLGTNFVMNTEIPAAIERNKKGNVNIIPILISPCDWIKTGLTEFNIYDKANPISIKSNTFFDLSKEIGVSERAEKWENIVKEIEKIIPNGSNPTSSSASTVEHDARDSEKNG